jgi:hypothetical protein
MTPRKKTPAPSTKKPRNIPAKNLADPRYRAKVEMNPKAYTRKPKHRPGKAESMAPMADDAEE